VAFVVQCDACGGSVVYDAERDAARCIFCGSVALRPSDLHEAIETPDVAIPFEVSSHRATAVFRRWSTSSWWYAKQLRDLDIELQAVMLPAWRFDAEVETHWAGLRRAATKSGVRPDSGVDTWTHRTLVPASMGIREAELHALLPFDERTTAPWQDQGDDTPYEAPALSRDGAAPVARARLSTEHRRLIAERESLRECRGGSIVNVIDTRLLMLPIYIGSFRYRDMPWRFVINAQTGRVTGKPPLDRVKIALVATAGAIALALWWWWSQS
jgi:hypothetical protein